MTGSIANQDTEHSAVNENNYKKGKVCKIALKKIHKSESAKTTVQQGTTNDQCLKQIFHAVRSTSIFASLL